MRERRERQDSRAGVDVPPAADDEPISGPLSRSTDARGDATGFSASWLDFTGRSLADQIGTGWLDAVHPDDRARVQAIRGVMSAARRAYAVEFRLRRHDGRHLWIGEQALPAPAPDGTFAGYDHHGLDVDARVRLSESLAARCQAMRAALKHHREVEAALAGELAPGSIERASTTLRMLAACGTGAGSLALVHSTFRVLLEQVAAEVAMRRGEGTVTLTAPPDAIDIDADVPMLARALADVFATADGGSGAIEWQVEERRVSIKLPPQAAASAVALLRFVVHLHDRRAAHDAAGPSVSLARPTGLR